MLRPRYTLRDIICLALVMAAIALGYYLITHGDRAAKYADPITDAPG